MMCKEAPLSIWTLDDPTLIWFVRLSIRVLQLHLLFVRTKNICRTLHHDHTSFRSDLTEKVIIDAVELVQLAGLAAPRLINHRVGFLNQLTAIRGKIPKM